MNIFATDPNPFDCASSLDDSRVVKMVLETAQLLCTALGQQGHDVPYKPCHAHHPATFWARSNPSWLLAHGRGLGLEYQKRFGRRHASSITIEHCSQFIAPSDVQPVSFYNGSRHRGLGLDFRHLPVHEAYRCYLNARWRMADKRPRWTNTKPPEWKED